MSVDCVILSFSCVTVSFTTTVTFCVPVMSEYVTTQGRVSPACVQATVE